MVSSFIAGFAIEVYNACYNTFYKSFLDAFDLGLLSTVTDIFNFCKYSYSNFRMQKFEGCKIAV